MASYLTNNVYSTAFLWMIILLTGVSTVKSGSPPKGSLSYLCNAKDNAIEWPSHIQTVLDATEPLKYDREGRLPLYLWQAMDPGSLEQEAAEELVKELDKRGVGLVASWDPNKRQKSLAD